MATLIIKDETYAKLARKALARNTTVESIVEPILDGLADTEPALAPGAATPTTDQRARALADWMAQVEKRGNRYPAGFVADDSRESIHEGRGE